MSDKNGRRFGRQVLTGIFVSLENRLKAILGQYVSSKLILAMKSSIIFMTFLKNGYIDVGDECLSPIWDVGERFFTVKKSSTSLLP